MNDLYPMKLTAVPVNMIWGGSRLRDKFGKPGAGDKTGETWELSVREKQMCIIENGKYAGMTVRGFIESAGRGSVSPNYDGGRFPLLIKFIDAADRLSVQVHPDNEYAGKIENDFGKTEMWYIIDADPGAEIIYGFAKGCTKEAFKKAFEEGKLEKVLNYIKVKPGDVFFIPAGLIHAIGKGIFIAEIQQNCDLTYRVYDYDRRNANGNTRELHIKKALDVVRPFTDAEIEDIRFSAASPAGRNDKTLLAQCDYFKVNKYDINGTREFSAGTESFNSLLCITGGGKIFAGDKDYPVKAGDSWLMPAGMGKYSVTGDMSFLLTTIK
jgi:mannose-6-phosphate isomerase